MKNIYLIPTDKPSRLCIGHESKLWLTQDNLLYIKDEAWKTYPQNIYITNSEEIKNCYVITDLDKVIKVDESNEEFYHQFNSKKIILTTDQDLIKDGVQEIDNDFLEWFVNNPNCEYVDIETFEVEDYVGFAGHTGYPTFHNEYKIIIQKKRG